MYISLSELLLPDITPLGPDNASDPAGPIPRSFSMYLTWMTPEQIIDALEATIRQLKALIVKIESRPPETEISAQIPAGGDAGEE